MAIFKKRFYYLDGGAQMIRRINRLDAGSVRIGTGNTLCKYCLFPYSETFHQMYPTIQNMNRPLPATCSLLKDGTVDFGIDGMQAADPAFQFTRLMPIHNIIVSNCPWAMERLTVNDLSELSLMLMEKENQTRIFIDDFMRRNGAALCPAIEAGGKEFLAEFPRIGIVTHV